MTQDEADTVAKIVATTDGNCPVCRDRMLDELVKRIPGVWWRRFDPPYAGWDDATWKTAEPLTERMR